MTRREFFMSLVSWLRGVSPFCGRSEHHLCNGINCGCFCHG